MPRDLRYLLKMPERNVLLKLTSIFPVLLVLSIAAVAHAQSLATVSGSMTSATATTQTPSTSSYMNSQQNPFQGSVPSGKPVPQVLSLSLRDAIERGLRYNLALLLNEQSTRESRGQRWVALSKMLPHLTTETREGKEMVNLKAIGFPSTIRNVNPISGPFSVFDTRAYLSSAILDFSALRNERAASEQIRAAQYTYQDARNLVVLVVGNAYLQSLAAESRVQEAEAQVTTAQALYQLAVDRFNAGLSPEIDMLRAQVELTFRKEQLIAAKNEDSTARLNLARVIGLPDGQQFKLTTAMPFEPLQGVTFENALADALANRPDYKAAEAAVRAAEQRRRAIEAERWPSLSFEGNYGDIGLTASDSHGTFLAQVSLKIPVFQGRRVHGELIQADAQLKQKQQQLDNLKGQISYDVRTSLLNLETAAQQVAATRSNVGLAQQTLTQARDRFQSGVTDNIEVIQAQEAVASADEAYITSLYQYNLAKVALARAMGIAEQAALRYLGEKQP
jgi:outer membrane protein TolC